MVLLIIKLYTPLTFFMHAYRKGLWRVLYGGTQERAVSAHGKRPFGFGSWRAARGYILTFMCTGLFHDRLIFLGSKHHGLYATYVSERDES